MNEKQGSMIGGMLLIAGSCIGAGMLGLPIVTGLSGFLPSLTMFFCAWLFMTSTALLLVEANGWHSRQVNLLTMTGQTLGKWGKGVCWITYLFLFYALLVAYISGIGGLCNTFFHVSLNASFPVWLGSLIFVILFGWVVYLGTRKVDLFNRGLMMGKIIFFILLVFIGVAYINPQLLSRSDPVYAPSALPLLVIAFGFHNMIPSLTAYLKGDLKKVRLTIIGGSLMAFVIYLIWEILVLGIVPFGGPNGLVASLKNDREASQSLALILKSPSVRIFSQGLAFFAILTSFLAQALSLVHFLADGLKIKYKKQENLWLCAVALLPPLVLSLIYPQLFFKALNFAGGVCAVILFGVLPVAMVWIGRYRKAPSPTYRMSGGKPALVIILCFALFILFLQLSTMMGASFIPKFPS
jgi:tyrosine-specific transport protein